MIFDTDLKSNAIRKIENFSQIMKYTNEFITRINSRSLCAKLKILIEFKNKAKK